MPAAVWVFYFFAAIVIWLGIVSLRGGLRFSRYVQTESAKPLSNYKPFASVIVPCRGVDQGLRENFSSLFRQDYGSYEIIFVTGDADDPSLRVVEEIVRAANHDLRIATRVVIAGDASNCGQKVHNLRAAVSETDPRSEVIVFFDTDVRPGVEWLRTLISPLVDENLGAATGYRWFIPVRGGFASQLRSVWNASIASALGSRQNKNFCWGGSTAIRKATFERLGVKERWRGTISDDFALTRALHDANLPIHFVPSCLVPSLEDCDLRELLQFTNRQLKITRVYAAHLWKPLLLGSLLFTAVFFGGLALVLVRAILGFPYSVVLGLLLVIYALGAAKAYVRINAVALPLVEHRALLSKSVPAHVLLWPLASALFLWNALVAGFSRRVEWRGIIYELKSANEAVIIARDK